METWQASVGSVGKSYAKGGGHKLHLYGDTTGLRFREGDMVTLKHAGQGSGVARVVLLLSGEGIVVQVLSNDDTRLAVGDTVTVTREDAQDRQCFSPAELDALKAQAREEALAPLMALLDVSRQGSEVQYWRVGNRLSMRVTVDRPIYHYSDGSFTTLTAAARALLAAVQAKEPKPCPCEGAEWKDGWWRWPTADPTVHCNTAPGRACPDCGRVMPPKPVAAMTIEECAAELATAPARTWYVSPRCGHWYVYDGLPSEGWFVKCATALDAWRAAVRKLREEGS